MLLLCEYTIVYQCSVDYAFVYQCSVSMLLYTSKYYKCNAASVAKRMQLPDYLLLNTHQQCWSSMCTNQIFQHSTEKLKKS